VDQLAQLIYMAGLAIFQALNTIVEPGSTDDQISASLAAATGDASAYEIRQIQMLEALQPFFPHYNPNWVAAYTQWVTLLIAQIQPFLQPIIVDGQEHGGHYDPAVIAGQQADIIGYMGDLNIFRNPANYPQWQAPYTDYARVALSAREDLTPGDFDANEIGIRAVQLASASD
jgi:hypothetical protein